MYKYLFFIAIKLIFQKIIGLLHLVGVHEFLKEKIFKRVIAPRSLLNKKLKTKLETLKLLNMPITGTVVEQGTGWHGQDCMLFILLGAKKVFSYDTTKWLNSNLVAEATLSLIENSDDIFLSSSLSYEEFKIKIEILKNYDGKNINEFFNLLGISTYEDKNFNFEKVPADSVQLFYTDSVLQRMTPDDLTDMFKSMKPKMINDSKNLHLVDCKDFHSIDTNSIPELAYLLVNSFWLKIIYSKYLNYQNQLRIDDYLKIFLDYGHKISFHNKLVEDKNIEFVKNNPSILSKYPKYNIEAIATSKFTVIFDNHSMQ